MKHSETAALLAVAAAFDNRKITEDAVEAWQRALHPDLNLADGRQIIVDHYADSNEWLKPAHINQSFKQLRRHRLDAAGSSVPPPLGLGLAEEQVWVRAFRRAIGAGAEIEKAEQYAAGQVSPDLEASVKQAQLETTPPSPEDEAARAANIERLRQALTIGDEDDD